MQCRRIESHSLGGCVTLMGIQGIEKVSSELSGQTSACFEMLLPLEERSGGPYTFLSIYRVLPSFLTMMSDTQHTGGF